MAVDLRVQRCRSILFASFRRHLTSCTYSAQTYTLYMYMQKIQTCIIIRLQYYTVSSAKVCAYQFQFECTCVTQFPTSAMLEHCRSGIGQNIKSQRVRCPKSDVRCPACGQDFLRDSYAYTVSEKNAPPLKRYSSKL